MLKKVINTVFKIKNVKQIATAAVSFACIATYSSSALAQECLSDGLETTPSSNFTAVTTNTLLDTTTDLVWRRCSEGQTWDGSTCSGEAVKYTWQEALQLAQQASNENLLGWRLPNVKELVSLVQRECVDPAIDLTVFPATPSDSYWSSTPNTAANKSDESWSVGFYNGRIESRNKQQDYYVRMVRYAE